MNEALEIAKKNMVLKEKILSEYACKSREGVWLMEDIPDIRPIFYRDIDRIIHSSGYARYIDKTQVYSFIHNDHITKRALHVQLVSKIARTIGRSLCLNEDLIEAISLGHDIGHAPFGHKGEEVLNDICIKENIGFFCHNAQSVRILKDIENLNISMQTLDGILAHNGEILKNKYTHNPNKTKNEFLQDIKNTFTVKDYSRQIVPMTEEASVVRISDVIAYIGRDIEDAITINSINRKDLPNDVVSILGNTNTKIVDTLIKDIIVNSVGKDYLQFSEEVFNSLINLQNWNYKYIYHSALAEKHYDTIEKLMNELYYFYLDVIEKKKEEDQSQKDLRDFAKKMQEHGEKNIKRIIIDYIAGETDKFFLKECENNLNYWDL